MELKTYKMGDLYTVSNGLSKGKTFFGQGYPFLTFSEVMNNFFVPETLQSLVQTEDKERTKFSIKRGDIFLNRTSETADELGISSVALKDYPNATFNGFCKRLRPITEDVVPEYIGYYLRTNAFRKHMSALTGSMITRASLRNEQLLSIEIELPSKEVQLKLANILRQYDLIIENCNKQIALLEEAAQRLYREWFVDLRFPGHDTTPVGENGLPEGWNYGTINKLGTFKRGKNILTKDAHGGSVPVIAGGLKPSCYHDKFNTSAPVITVSGSGANAGYASIFTIPVWASDCSYLDSNSSTSIYYIYCFLKNNPLILLSKQKGSAQPHVYARDINDTKILIPRNKHLSDFCNVSQFYFNEIGNLRQLKNNALMARDLLLPNLISGQIEIIV